MTEADLNPALPFAALGDSLDRIPNYIHKNLFDLDAIRGDMRQWPHIDPDSHAVGSSLVGEHADHLVCNRR